MNNILVLCILLASILIILVLLLILFISRLDCNLFLYLCTKFGKPVKSLEGKVCWITGASSGIGQQLALLLAKSGVRLAISGTNEQKLQEVKRLCVAAGLEDRDVLIVSFDIRDTDKHQTRLISVLQHFHQLDILVANAGRTQRATFVDIDIEVDRQLFDINVFGLISLSRVVLRYFIDNDVRGQFVVTSSTSGKMGSPYSSSYSASKHALHGYFETLRTEVYENGIEITMACPGPVFSSILTNVFTEKVNKTANMESVNSKHSHRMSGQRCAKLMATAMANTLKEVWICKQPLLSLYYLHQYLPTITSILMPRLATKERLNKYREGTE